MSTEHHDVVPKSRHLIIGIRDTSAPDAHEAEDAHEFGLEQLEELLLALSEGGAELEPIGSVEKSRTFRATVTETQAMQLFALGDLNDQLIVEEDQRLTMELGVDLLPLAVLQHAQLASGGATVQVRVIDEESEEPVPGAAVIVYDYGFPIRAMTDENGEAQLMLFSADPESVTALLVNPGASGHWSWLMQQPLLSTDIANVVRVSRLESHYPSFPEEEAYGWGQRAMGVDQIDAYGQDVRVAIIDSGAAEIHPDLHSALGGHDFTPSDDAEETWSVDTVGHGSHVTGTVSGIANQSGVLGVAPEAAIHSLKVFPGGRLSWLIDALHRSAEEGAAIASMSLGFDNPSELVHQAIQAVTQQGVACIAAAGNSGGPVKYPAAYPEVLPVTAIGQKGTYPETSRHALQVGHEATDGSGFFSARFTCFGEQVAARGVCAPGVAVVSSVPEAGYAAWDGTSMACPHVTGIAALILATDSDISSLAGAERVDALFQALRRCSRPLEGIPPEYQGAGLPDASLAVAPEPAPAPGWSEVVRLLQAALDQAKSLA